MRYGLVFPNMDLQTVPSLAAEVEAAGWDGVFTPDCVNLDGRRRTTPRRSVAGWPLGRRVTRDA